MSRALQLVALGALAVGLVACGDDDDDAAPATTMAPATTAASTTAAPTTAASTTAAPTTAAGDDSAFDGDTAEIVYDVEFGGNPAYGDQVGTLTLVDGAWTVGRDEFCSFMASARVGCEEA